MRPAGTFYHFTSERHLPSILETRALWTTESNVGSPVPRHRPHGSFVGPDVVWLLDTLTVGEFSHGLAGSASDKTAIRFTLAIPAIPWLQWEPAQQMDPAWRNTLVSLGGGEEAAEHWYVFPAQIRVSRWLALTDMRDNSLLCVHCGSKVASDSECSPCLAQYEVHP